MPASKPVEFRRRAVELELANAIFEWIEAFYNPIRRHSALGYLSPVDHERLHIAAPTAAWSPHHPCPGNRGQVRTRQQGRIRPLPIEGGTYSSPENRSHADCRAIPRAAPIRAQLTPRPRSSRTHSVSPSSTWVATFAI